MPTSERRTDPDEYPSDRRRARDLAMLAVAALVWLAAAHVVPDLTDRLTTGGWIPPDAESVQVDDRLAREFERRATSHLVLFEPTTPDITTADQDFRREVTRLSATVLNVPGVTAIYTPMTAPTRTMQEALIADDHSSWLAVVQVGEDLPTAISHLPALEAALESPVVDAAITGVPALSDAFAQQVKSDLLRAEMIAFPIAFLALIWFAGGVRTALAIILATITSLSLTVLLIGLVSSFTEISIFALSTITMLTIALSLDFALLYILRHRERDTPANRDSRVRITVLISGITVALGMAGLLVVNIPAAASIGWIGMIGVASVVAVQIAFLPSMMRVLRGQAHQRHRAHGSAESRSQVLQLVQRNPKVALALGLALLIPVMIPVAWMEIAGPGSGILPDDNPSASALERVEERFPDVPISPIYVIADPVEGSMLGAANLFSLGEAADQISDVPGVSSVMTIWDLVPGTVTSPMLTASLALNPTLVEQARPLITDQAAVIEILPDRTGLEETELVERFRANAAALSDGELRLQVGGVAATNLDLLTSVQHSMVQALAIVLGTTVITLMAAFRSILLPIKVVVLNTLPVLSALGVVTLLFQTGTPWSEGSGTTVILIPMILAWLMFGVSMDYELFMLTRIQECRQQGMDNTAATIMGIDRARGLVARGAILMSIVFAAFATSDITVIRATGVGLVVAIVVDATIVRMLLLPASMILLGRWNWWWPQRTSSALRQDAALVPEGASSGERA